MLKNPVTLIIITPIILFLLLAGCNYLITSEFNESPHKTDDELIDNFQNHRAEFGNLLQMIKEDRKQYDGLFRIDKDWTEPKEPEKIGVSKERILQYREIFQKLNIPRGFYSYDNGTEMV